MPKRGQKRNGTYLLITLVQNYRQLIDFIRQWFQGKTSAQNKIQKLWKTSAYKTLQKDERFEQKE